MRLTFLGTGPTERVPKSPDHPINKVIKGSPKSYRLQSSLLIDNRLLVDASMDFLKSVKKLRIEPKLEGVLITHAHKDACMGLKDIEPYIKTKPIPVVSLPHTIKLLKTKRVGERDYLKYIAIQPQKRYRFLGYTIEAIPVKHSILPEFDPTIAWQINNIVYAEDVDQEWCEQSKSKNAEYFRNKLKEADLVIFDGAMYKGHIRGHWNILDAARWLKELGVKRVIFTQIGNEAPKYEDLRKEIKQINPSYDVAYDGMTINSAKLSRLPTIGIYVIKPYHEKILRHEVDWLLRTRKLKVIGEPILVCSGKHVWGVITLTREHVVQRADIPKYRKLHKLPNFLIDIWFGRTKTFYAYEYEVNHVFKEPVEFEYRGAKSGLLHIVPKRHADLFNKFWYEVFAHGS